MLDANEFWLLYRHNLPPVRIRMDEHWQHLADSDAHIPMRYRRVATQVHQYQLVIFLRDLFTQQPHDPLSLSLRILDAINRQVAVVVRAVRRMSLFNYLDW